MSIQGHIPMADLCQSFKLSTQPGQMYNVLRGGNAHGVRLRPIAVTEKGNDHDAARSWVIQLSVLLEKPDR